MVWRYKESLMVEIYEENMSSNHAELGVGTGYCIDKANIESQTLRIGLFDQIQPILNNNARVFGYTLVRKDIVESLLSRFFFSFLSKFRIFNNYRDSATLLKQELERRFKNTQVTVVGQLAYFSADYSLTRMDRVGA